MVPHPRIRRRGRLVRRFKRFLADVELDDGQQLTVHCPNSGSMKGLSEVGSRVLVSDSEDPRRKLRWTWELVRCGASWVGINTARSNAVVRDGLNRGSIVEAKAYPSVRPEVVAEPGTRLDFLLEGEPGRFWIEVKNVTLAENRVARFPDAVTARGRRHLEALARRVGKGERAAVLFLVNREDCCRFEVARDIDSAYAETLERVRDEGVEILVYDTRVRVPGLEIRRPLFPD